ncbi:MAG: hypothetical protein FWC70_04220 [Defluviitaleaceae bacterium]|nr:hypothetical protein [Defluviitaleaceae bacterium]
MYLRFKRLFCVLMVCVLAVGALPGVANANIQPFSIDITADFTCPNFLAAVREVAGVPTGAVYLLDVQDIQVLGIVGRGITSLDGIEHFHSLSRLYAGENELTSADFSNNTLLHHAALSSNNLTSVNFSNNPLLWYISVYHNNLTSLDVSNNPMLAQLWAGDNALTSLDVSNNPSLYWLLAGDNALSVIDLSQNPSLRYLTVAGNPLTTLNLSNNPLLESLNFSHTMLTALDMTHNPNLRSLRMGWSYNGTLATINVSNNPLLEILHVNGTILTSLDVTQNPNLRELSVNYGWVHMPTLDVSNNPLLEVLNMRSRDGFGLDSIDISNNPRLEVLDLHNSNLTTLDVSNNPNLVLLNVSSNELTDIDLSGNPALRTLILHRNNLTSLNVSHLNLESLYLWRNLMSEPDDVIGWRNSFNNVLCCHDRGVVLGVHPPHPEFFFHIQNTLGTYDCTYCRDIGCPDCAPVIPGDVDFFYVINFGDETIRFGQTFNVWAANRPVVNAAGVPIVGPAPERRPVTVWPAGVTPAPTLRNVNRSEISFIFNRRADSINPNRGNWTMTLTGEANISRHLNRGGWIGVRRTVRGQHELIALIEIPARPANRDIRAYRRDIYVPTRAVADGTGFRINNHEYLWNPTAPGGASFEIRVGDDRRLFGTNAHVVTASNVMPGERISLSHDSIPRGTRGTFRIAHLEAVNFATRDNDTQHIRDWIAAGETSLPGYGNLQELLDAGGSFGSAPVAFRIPAQPNAPATARMLVTPGRNGAPAFISRTNRNMHVKLGYDAQRVYDDGGNFVGIENIPVWQPLSANQPVHELLAMFDNAYPTARPRPVSGDNYSFEFRVIRAGRILSAPGFFTWSATDLVISTNVSASVSPVVVRGRQYAENYHVSRPAGVNVNIVTAGGRADAGLEGTNVTSWFGTSIPDGLTATVTRVNGANIRINIQGIPASTSDLPMTITIPDGAIPGWANPIVVTNAGDGAIFNIAPPTTPGYVPAVPDFDYAGDTDDIPDNYDYPDISADYNSNYGYAYAD